MGVDMMACDDSSDAWHDAFRLPADSALQDTLPSGKFRRFLRTEMVELVLDDLIRAQKES